MTCPRPALKYQGLRYARTMADAFPDIRAFAGERYVAPGMVNRIVAFLRRKFV